MYYGKSDRGRGGQERGRGSKGGRGRGIDPADEGDLPSYLFPLSRSLIKVLRHTGRDEGLQIDQDGWCNLDDVMRLNGFSRWSNRDIETVVQESFSKARPRFELCNAKGRSWIRATHKHSCLDTWSSDASPSATHTSYSSDQATPKNQSSPLAQSLAPPPLKTAPTNSAADDKRWPSWNDEAKDFTHAASPSNDPTRVGNASLSACDNLWTMPHDGSESQRTKSNAKPPPPVFLGGPKRPPPPPPVAQVTNSIHHVVEPSSTQSQLQPQLELQPQFQQLEQQPVELQLQQNQQQQESQQLDLLHLQPQEELVQHNIGLEQQPVELQLQQKQQQQEPQQFDLQHQQAPIQYNIGEDDVTDAAVNSMEEAGHDVDAVNCITSSLHRIWMQYRIPDDGEGNSFWWYCDLGEGEQESFREDSPGSWQKFMDPASDRPYWFNNDTEEFFFAH